MDAPIKKLDLQSTTVNRFIHPFRAFIVGPSQVGKSSLVRELLRSRKQLFTTEYSKILYCVPEKHLENQREFLTSLTRICPEVEIRGGLPTFGDIRSTTLPKCIVLDDLMLNMNANLLDELYSQDSHHYSCSVILVLHDYFQSRTTRTIYRSVNYKFLFNDPGNSRYVRDISSQISSNPSMLSKCFLRLEELCPKTRFQCLLIDSHPQSPLKKFLIRGNFLPEKDGKIRPILFQVD